MNFTIKELINAIKYHGHQYDLTTLEILEGIARQIESDNEALEEQHEKEIDNQISNALTDRMTEINESIECIFENTLEDLKDDTEEMIKKFPKDQARLLIESDIKRQAITEFCNKIKNKIDNYRD